MTLAQPRVHMERFHQVLVEEIRRTRPDYLEKPFTVAEVYQQLVPYGSHRERLELEMNGDYEDVLLRLLAGEGGYLVLESDAARKRLQEEVESSNPDTGIYREYAAVDVRLNPELITALDATEEPPPEESVAVEELAPDDVAPEIDAAEARDVEPGEGAGLELFEAEEEAPTEGTVGSGADESATCAWCREALPERDNLNFCPFCGTSVDISPCPACGEGVEAKWLFCAACGTEVPEE